MTTIKATVPAWITNEHTTLAGLFQATPEQAVGALKYYGDSDMTSCGWVKVGTAEVTLTFESTETVVNNQIAVLRKAKELVQAEAQRKLNELDERIGNLLCLEHKPAIDN